jgi:carbonic anhydrase
MADCRDMPDLRSWTRRLSNAAAMGAVFLVTTSMAPRAAESAGRDPLARLREGNERFVKGVTAAVPSGATARQALAAGEQPFAMVLSCTDARVPPEYVFNAALGELFVVRSAGQVADRAVVASLEYGAHHLHLPLLVVMGHEACGVVKAATGSEPGKGALDYLMSQIRAGLRHAPKDEADLRAVILDNVEQVINDMLDGSDVLRAAVSEGRLQVVGAYYELASGRVMFSAPVGAPTAHR